EGTLIILFREIGVDGLTNAAAIVPHLIEDEPDHVERGVIFAILRAREVQLVRVYQHVDVELRLIVGRELVLQIGRHIQVAPRQRRCSGVNYFVLFGARRRLFVFVGVVTFGG